MSVSKMSHRCNTCQVEASSTVQLQLCGTCLVTSYCCREHQRLDWTSHKNTCLSPDKEIEIQAFAKRSNAKLQSQKTLNPECFYEIEKCDNGIMEFVQSHPFPPISQVENYILTGQQSYDLKSKRNLLVYELAKKLYEAGGLATDIKRAEEIRRVGYLLSKSMKKMQFHYYLIQHLICGAGIWPEERKTYGLGYCAVATYAKTMESNWDGVGPWQA